jgi:hypothetical protein
MTSSQRQLAKLASSLIEHPHPGTQPVLPHLVMPAHPMSGQGTSSSDDCTAISPPRPHAVRKIFPSFCRRLSSVHGLSEP